MKNVVAAVPLLFQARSLVSETVGWKSVDARFSKESVSNATCSILTRHVILWGVHLAR